MNKVIKIIFETYAIVLNEEKSNIKPSVVEYTFINNNTTHIDKPLLLTDTGIK